MTGKARRLLPKGKLKTAILIAASLVFTFFLLGWQAGRALSPDHNSERAAKEYIRRHLRIDRLEEGDVWLSTRAGDTEFAYRLSEDRVRPKILPADLAATNRLGRRNILNEHDRLMVLASITAAPAGLAGTFGKVARLASKSGSVRRSAIFIASGLVAIAGGALGFYFGYDEAIDFDAPAFASGMRREEVWRSLAVALRDCFIARNAQVTNSAASDPRGFDPDLPNADTRWIAAGCARAVVGSRQSE